MNTSKTSSHSGQPTFIELFTPKLITILKEGYTLTNFRTDVIAGLTVAIVALPLSMAIAIASGASPIQGIYTAIFGGFIVSLLGGSRFQIGGPAGAFIILVSTTIQLHGMDGLILATILSGGMLAVIGFFQLGTYIKFIPYPVTIGFTAGIAVIIFASQVRELLGLKINGVEPGPLLEKIPVLFDNIPSFDMETVALSLATIIIIAGLKKIRPNWPGMLIAVAGTSLLATLYDFPVTTIGSEFGGIQGGVPLPALPEFTIEKVQSVLPNAIAFTLLGSIESLLSAVVADGMTGRHHRSNCELVGQGIANIFSGLFGGICVTGNIARTVTNVRAGAHGPVAGMMHSVFLLLFILFAAPLINYIPLASLAGVLAIVAWNMIEKQAFITLLRASKGDAAVLLSTFLLTVFRDLTEAIIVGFSLGALIFINRMSKTTAIETHAPFVREDTADISDDNRKPYDHDVATDPDIIIYRITGAFFFGAAASIGAALDRISDTHRCLIIDFEAVPFLDSTAASIIESVAHKSRRKGIKLILTGTSHDVREALFVLGVKPPLVSYFSTIARARNSI